MFKKKDVFCKKRHYLKKYNYLYNYISMIHLKLNFVNIFILDRTKSYGIAKITNTAIV